MRKNFLSGNLYLKLKMNKRQKAKPLARSSILSQTKGQGLSVNAIILIVLGIVVLVVLILGFTMGWEKIAPWISGNNVENIVTACNVACNTQSQYDFCTAPRDLKADDAELKDVTCYYLAKKQTKYGINSCAGIPCSNVVLSDTPAQNVDSINCDDNAGKTVYALSSDGKTLLSKDCPQTS